MRGKLYELLANCIPPDLIIKGLLPELLKKIDDELKNVSDWAAAVPHAVRLSGLRRLTAAGGGPSAWRTVRDPPCAQEVVALAAFYDVRLQEGQKAIFHLEAFVAKFLSLYKNYVVAAMA